MTRDELIGLGQRILAEEDDEVLDGLMAEFDRNVPHPEGWNARSGDPADYAPTAEEVVDTCLAYRPICL